MTTINHTIAQKNVWEAISGAGSGAWLVGPTTPAALEVYISATPPGADASGTLIETLDNEVVLLNAGEQIYVRSQKDTRVVVTPTGGGDGGAGGGGGGDTPATPTDYTAQEDITADYSGQWHIYVRGGDLLVQRQQAGNWVTTDTLSEGGYQHHVKSGEVVRLAPSGATGYTVVK